MKKRPIGRKPPKEKHPRSFWNSIGGMLWKFGTLWLDPRQSPYASSGVLMSALFLVLSIYFTPYFQRPDDAFRWMAAKGVGISLAPQAFFPHSSLLLGFLLCRFGSWVPSVPWYGLFLLGLLFGGGWAFLAGLFLRGRFGLNFFFFLILFLAIEPYFFFQLGSASAAQMAAYGAFFLAASLAASGRKEAPAGGIAFCGLLLAGGFLANGPSFFFAVLVGAPWLARRIRRSSRLSPLWARMAFLLALFLFSSILADRLGFQARLDWRDFEMTDGLRSSLQDFRAVRYDNRTKPLFDSLGWTPNDFQLWEQTGYLDPGLQTAGNYGKLIPLFPRCVADGKRGSVGSLAEVFRSRKAQTLMICFFVFALFMETGEVGMAAAAVFWVLLLFLARIYFFICPEDWFLPALAFLAALAVYHARSGAESGLSARDHRFFRLTRSFVLFSCLLLIPQTVHFYYGFDDFLKQGEAHFKDALAQWEPRADQLFIVADPFFPFQTLPALGDLGTFRNFHLLPLRPLQLSPLGEAMAGRFRITGDLFREMTGRPDLFLVCSPGQGGLVGAHLSEKFNLNVRAETYFDPLPWNGDWKVYRILP